MLYEIVNETNHNSRQFQYHMVNYIRNYEATNKPMRHPVGMTSYRDPANEPGGANSDLFTSPADYIAPGLNPYRDSPPAADGRKVIILDTDHTLTCAKKMNLAAMTPRSDLSSTTYCLAEPGNEYLVYLPKKGEAFSVEVKTGTYCYEWFNPTEGALTDTGRLDVADGKQQFKAPFEGDAVLYLEAQ